MPPFRYNPYRYYRNYYQRPRRRFPFRRRRPRKPFRRRKRRHRWVRKRSYFYKNFKKLKKLRLSQFQPNKIKKCKIKGYLQLFGGGTQRISSNFTLFKESVVPPQEPGGGGWGLQQLNLGNLYIQNQYIMNWWTKSNKGYNLCRYLGLKITLYRQQKTDYIFCWEPEPPYEVTKYLYPSYHPYKLLTYNKRIIVPSMETMPHKRKPYIKKYIKPPKEMKNQWHFQQHFANYPLIQFVATSCSLNSMFMPTTAISNNITIYTLNTRFFSSCNFTELQQSQWGYTPRQNSYLYGIQQPKVPWNETPLAQVTYLGNTMINDAGDEIGQKPITDYGLAHWGNPLFYRYLNGDFLTFLSSKNPQEFFGQPPTRTQTIKNKDPTATLQHEDMVEQCRYNPNHDQGTGNVAFWVKNNSVTSNKWEEPKDPALKIQDFPLWLLLWGWADYTRHITHLRNIDEDYILVVRSRYMNTTMPNFVFLATNYIEGETIYTEEREHIPLYDMAHWYPKWRYQQPAIENLLHTGPAVCKNESQKSVQAHMKYTFFFKWGGNPSAMENIYDPTAQPIWTPTNPEQTTHEITNPTTNIANYIYEWDTRRDIITQKALNRIKQIETDDILMFTDGTTNPPQKTTPQEKKTKKTQEEALLQQLLNIQQLNQQLQFRFRQLKQLAEST
nr:MAG: ORF1 [TTV-like mini virus]